MFNLILNCTPTTIDRVISFKDAAPWILTLILAIINFIQLRKTEGLKNELQKKLNVHKLQFEKEFEIYQVTWEFASKLRSELNILKVKHGEFIKTIDNEASAEKKEYVILELSNSRSIIKKIIDELQNYVERNEPFYPNEVYNKIIKYIDQSYFAEIINFFPEFGVTVSEDLLGKNLDEAIDNLNDVSKAIRERIGILSKN